MESLEAQMSPLIALCDEGAAAAAGPGASAVLAMRLLAHRHHMQRHSPGLGGISLT